MRFAALVCVLGSACTSPSDRADTDDPGDTDSMPLPSVAELPERADPPAALALWADGAPVTSTQAWETRRAPEIDRLFSHYVDGGAPARDVLDVEVLARQAVAGATLVQLDVTLDGGAARLAVWLPEGQGPFPVLIGLNKCGNSTVSTDVAVDDQGLYRDPTCSAARGSRADYWSIELALSAGIAVATVHQSAFAPDDRFAVHRDPVIATWAAGLSAMVAALATLPEVDPQAVTVFGHSRRGKAALFAGARDPHIAGVWAHQSGTVGAALTRSFNGESLGAITSLFPHWFAPRLAEFVGEELRLPVDQHLLLARIAPRPLLVTDGDADAWADPSGAERAVALATEVYDLYGAPAPQWGVREGGHDVREVDWALVVAWLVAL